MSERESGGIMLRTGRWVLAVATLSALIFVPAGSSRAQSQSTTPESTPAAATPPAKVAVVDTATVTQTATTKPAAELAAPQRESAPKGQSEGIKVHGHWTIEVRNPDGKLVTRREFENAVQTNGELFIEAALTGGLIPGGFAVALNMANDNFVQVLGGSTFTGGEASPCNASSPCFIAPPPPASGALSPFQIYCNDFDPGNLTFCSYNLQVVAPTVNIENGTFPGANQIALSGSIIAQVGGTVKDVETVLLACSPGSLVGSCQQPVNISLQSTAFFVFTERTLDGVSPDPGPITVTPQQTIAVNVTLTFQ
jgi:hypothetical protein